MNVFRSMFTSRHHPYFLTAMGSLLILCLSLPISRALLESSLIYHMLIQIPLLVWAGWMISSSFTTKPLKFNEHGIPGLLVAIFAILFWMIPRWLDTALSDPVWEVIKFMTVPLFIGIPLGISWGRLSPFSRAVVWANTISMLLILGWLYVAAPVRICNNYLVNQQQDLGYTVMGLSTMVTLYWVGKLFFGSWEQR